MVKKYPVYKDSGVEWIEDVPSHWEVKKFKRVFYEIKKRSNPELNCGSISFGKVVYKDDEKIPESTKRSYQVVQEGDFLVNPLNLNYDLISLRIALSDIDVVVSSGYIVLSNSVKLDKTFYKYFLHRFDVAFMKLLGSGVRQTLNWNDIANCDLIFPPLPEQTAIANFLDRKTALIDQAIEIKQKQIELLKERRQILIHKAVTRGLNPNVKMKDSGVEWIGEIPEHWEVKRLKYLASYFKGNAFSSTVFSSEGIPIVKASNIKKWSIENITSFVSLDNQKRAFENFRLIEGDIIISTVGSKPEIKESSVGQLAIVNKEYDGSYLNQNTVCIRPKKDAIDKYYLKCVFTSNYLRANFDSISLWIANQAYIEIDNILQIAITAPPKYEQIAISEYIGITSTKIATAISLKEQEIEKLKEYKATLINSAVTGKIKFC
ncbi:restriction endonuclease subunit S [Aquirufa sp. ROCK2-A2]